MQDPGNIFDRIRSACHAVAGQSTHIRIDYEYLPTYADQLPVSEVVRPELDPDCHYLEKKKDTVAFLLTLDSINFGSGYFPHLHKRPGKSGYFTIASTLNDFYRSRGPISAERLAEITAAECTRLFDQDPKNKDIGMLMQHFARALNDLGRFLMVRFNGCFTDLVDAAESSAGRLVQLLAQMPYFMDVEGYNGIEVPFFKRAQITAADLSLAFDGRGWGLFNDLDQLTIFADNLVPHVLRMDKILIYEESLVARIEAGKLIPAGSTEEVEIRACALHAVELIREQIKKSGRDVTSSELDYFLWNRGQQPEYKAIPRHRTRSVFY